jgi:hypothetical protein
LDQEVALRLGVVPSLEEDLIRYFELVVALLAYPLQTFYEGHECFLRLEGEFGPVQLQIDILPLEIGDGLTAVGDEVVDVPPRLLPLLAVQLRPVNLLQLFTLQVLLARHQQVSHKFLYPRVCVQPLFAHHQQAIHHLFLIDRPELPQQQF